METIKTHSRASKMRTLIKLGPLKALLRECWILASNKCYSSCNPDWINEPTIHSIVVESVRVEEPFRKQGLFKRLITELCEDTKYEMAVVEQVQNPILIEALIRWGWECDKQLSDFYRIISAKS